MITNVFLFLVPPYIPYEGIKIANMRLINYCDTYNSLMTRCSLPKYKSTQILLLTLHSLETPHS